jgi:hypothetical protein
MFDPSAACLISLMANRHLELRGVDDLCCHEGDPRRSRSPFISLLPIS